MRDLSSILEKNTKDLLDYLADLVDNHPEDAIRVLQHCFHKIHELEKIVEHFSARELQD